MAKFTIIEGHPDPSASRLNRALADRYAEAAVAAGHEVRRIDVARMEIPLLRSADEFVREPASNEIRAAQADIAWADRLAVFFPLWIGDMPALLKAFVEQTFRPGFALGYGNGRSPRGLLTGKSARIVVTMGMPSLIYRTLYGEHAIKSLILNLGMCGVAPARATLIGNAGEVCESRARRLFARMERLAKRDARPQGRTIGRVAAGLAGAGAAAAGAYLAYAALTWARFGSAAARSSSLLDRSLPQYDVHLHHEIKIHAPAARTFETVCRADMERSLVVQALFRLRELILGARHEAAVPAGGLIEQLQRLGWSIVAEEAGRELVLGAVTQPWKPNPAFIGLSPGEFVRFNVPGYAKIAVTLRVDAIDEEWSVARTETRVATTDPVSRERFRRYWAFLSPGIEIVRIVLLARLKAEAESSATVLPAASEAESEVT